MKEPASQDVVKKYRQISIDKVSDGVSSIAVGSMQLSFMYKSRFLVTWLFAGATILVSWEIWSLAGRRVKLIGQIGEVMATYA